MKKRVVLFLFLFVTTILMHNIVGFYLYRLDQKEKSWIYKVQDVNFKVLKLNASVYSFIEDTELEIVNENIIVNNKVYFVFKKQILNNILYLYYLPNFNKSIQNINLKSIVDAETYGESDTNKKPLEKIFKSLVKDYLPREEFNFNTRNTHFQTTPVFYDLAYGCICSGYTFPNHAPPKFI